MGYGVFGFGVFGVDEVVAFGADYGAGVVDGDLVVFFAG